MLFAIGGLEAVKRVFRRLLFRKGKIQLLEECGQCRNGMIWAQIAENSTNRVVNGVHSQENAREKCNYCEVQLIIE